jgi:hypothetical protein
MRRVALLVQPVGRDDVIRSAAAVIWTCSSWPEKLPI